MSNNISRSFDGFYGFKPSRRSYGKVEIQAGGYNPNFEQLDSEQDNEALQISQNQPQNEIVEQTDQTDYNQYDLADWYKSAYEVAELPEIEESVEEESNFDSNSSNIKVHFFEQELPFVEAQVAQISDETNTDSSSQNIEEIPSQISLTAEESELLYSLRKNPKVNQKKVLRF